MKELRVYVGLTRRSVVAGARKRLRNREAMDKMIAFSRYLLPSEQQLPDSHWNSHFTFYELAKIHHTGASTIRTRLQGLMRRLANPLFVATIVYGKYLPDDLEVSATSRYVRGNHARDVARDLRFSVPEVRYRFRCAKWVLQALLAHERNISGPVAVVPAGH